MRILLTFLMDPDARPTPKDMKLWVDVIRFVKRGAKKGALGFFTYMELSECPAFPFFRCPSLVVGFTFTVLGCALVLGAASWGRNADCACSALARAVPPLPARQAQVVRSSGFP